MRWCLRWLDEEPKSVSPDIYEKFLDLIIVRSFIHLGKPPSKWHIVGPKTSYFIDVWQAAIEEVPFWPGFKRLKLNKKDRDFFESERGRDLSDFL